MMYRMCRRGDTSYVQETEIIMVPVWETQQNVILPMYRRLKIMVPVWETQQNVPVSSLKELLSTSEPHL